MSKLSQIEQKIKEVCPWLMELTFGCRIKVDESVDDLVVVKENKNGNYNVFNVHRKESYAVNFSLHDVEILGHPPQLSDLLYTIGKVDAFCCYTQSNGTLCIQQENDEKKWCNYDLIKSLRENLENEELCDFIHQLICK